jgi:hypothetical protein
MLPGAWPLCLLLARRVSKRNALTCGVVNGAVAGRAVRSFSSGGATA